MDMHPVERRYKRELFSAISAYTVAILVSTWLLKHVLGDAPAWQRAGIGLLPMVPVALVVRAMVRLIRDTDEMQRRIDLEAAAIAGTVVGLGYFTCGLLASARVITVAGETVLIWAFPLLLFIFGIAKGWTRRRYR